MKRTINRLVPIIFLGALMQTGCATQATVKPDAPLNPSAAKQAQNAPSQSGASAAQPQSTPITAPAVITKPLNGGELAGSQQDNGPAGAAELRKDPLERIYFDFDDSTLSEAARQTLTRNFEALKQSALTKVRIEGHCDERGSDDYNLALSERRAQSARHYLTALGVPAERLSTIGYGKEKPADSGHDQTAWAKNRRDEFVVIK